MGIQTLINFLTAFSPQFPDVPCFVKLEYKNKKAQHQILVSYFSRKNTPIRIYIYIYMCVCGCVCVWCVCARRARTSARKARVYVYIYFA